MQKKSLYWQVPLLVFLVVGTFFIARQNRNERLADQQQQNAYQHDKGEVFGTFYSVTYQAPSSLQADIDKALAQVDGEFSMFNPNSTEAAINRGEDP